MVRFCADLLFIIEWANLHDKLTVEDFKLLYEDWIPKLENHVNKFQSTSKRDKRENQRLRDTLKKICNLAYSTNKTTVEGRSIGLSLMSSILRPEIERENPDDCLIANCSKMYGAYEKMIALETRSSSYSSSFNQSMIDFFNCIYPNKILFSYLLEKIRNVKSNKFGAILDHTAVKDGMYTLITICG